MSRLSGVTVAALAMFALACQPVSLELTNEQKGEIGEEVEQVWAGLVTAAEALNPDPIRAAYAENPVVVLNGVIIEDFDARFELTRQFLGSLRILEGSYKNVHMEVLAPDAVVVTRNDDLAWTDTTGAEGEWHSAWTGVLRRIDGQWKIIYAHESVAIPE
jgi:ketosteroid isomerase-like protein